MTRLDLLKILVGQARNNGFDFRHWYVSCLRLPWESPNTALATVETQGRYYALLFNHSFAQAFWKTGQPITFQVPAQSFQRTMADGSIRVVERKPFMRRSNRPDAWKYHLREMALAEEPLRYMRRYLHVEDDLIDEEPDTVAAPLKAATTGRPLHTPIIAPRLGLNTLALARQAAERRKKAVDALPPMPPPSASSSKRRARLPGSR
jgi:hypothetical protein